VGTSTQVLEVLDTVLSLQGRALTFDGSTALLGSVPELDSMAVVSLIAALEDRFGIVVEDDEIEGAIFATVGSLVEFVERKLAA
jgi:acyl carrier protein